MLLITITLAYGQEIGVSELPEKQNLWVFVMAGQSNMAGRGTVAPLDTITDKRIITVSKEGKWIIAKEPIEWPGLRVVVWKGNA